MDTATDRAARIRRECPLRTCDWSHTERLPNVLEGTARSILFGYDPLKRYVDVERMLREHFDTHTSEELLREIAALRSELAEARREEVTA